MSNKGIINTALYRPLQGGNYYSKLIPSSTCKRTNLGKGDTSFSMQGIKASILKNYKQCAKLAPQLQKGSTAATATAIYDFLYNHIQYKADEADQNLRSPACSWASRQDGIDCKSYSIFAGCLLAAMQPGIKFYIRRIKQPGMLPNEYTHVYIVVPKDQKTGSLKSGHYVIDATKHQNTEAAYIEKSDVYMDTLNHFGLQAPVTTSIKGRFEPVPQDAMDGFKDFLCFLRKIGIDERVISKIRETIMKFISQGINPEFGFADEGVVIEGQLIKYAYPEVHGRRMYRSPITVALAAGAGQNGLNASEGNSTTTTEGELGDELTTVVTGMLDDPNWWDSTFGAIFGNGWDLTCYGSSNSPKKAQEQTRIDVLAYFESSGIGDKSKGGLTTENLQKFIDMSSAYIWHRHFGSKNKDLAKCTRDGNNAGYEGMSSAQNQVLEETAKILNANEGTLEIAMLPGVPLPKFIELKNYNYPVPSGYLKELKDDPRFKTFTRRVTVTSPVTLTIGAPNPVFTTPKSGITIKDGKVTIGGVTIPVTKGGSGGTNPTNSTNPKTGGSPPPKGSVYTPGTVKGSSPKQMGINTIITVGLIAGGLFMAYKNKSK